VVEVTRYTVEAERGRLRWSLQAVEVPGAISEVDRLTQAAEYMREAISFVTGEPQDQIEVDVIPIISAETREHLDNARRLRDEAAKANAAAAAERRAAARSLRAAGLSVREIGAVLEVSHQRAQQLLEA
jgi:hypothetical protein